MLQILYQDECCVVINKPTKMLVHRSWLDRHETVFVMQTLRDQLGKLVYPVHRLDRPTSGALLFALDSDSARVLSGQFEEKTVQKQYLAVVRGYAPERLVIDYPLKVRLDKIADKFADSTKPPEDAITKLECLATTEQPFVSCARFATSRYSLVRLTPTTGRKHQLRRHMKHIFHPIVGDTTYGDKVQNRAITANLGVNRLLLHAQMLEFTHPKTGERVAVRASVDGEFTQVLERFGWQDLGI